MLHLEIESLDSVAEAIRAEYEAATVNGKTVYRLKTDADAKLKEFRANNIALMQEVADLKQRNQSAPSADTFSALQRSVEELAASNKRFQSELELQRARSELHKAFLKAGGKESALVDAESRFSQVFQPNEKGGRTPKLNGQVVMSKRNPAVELSIEEFVETMKVEADHLFAKPSGAGSTGGSSTETRRAAGNPWINGTLNYAEQIRITKTDPALAARYKTEAAIENAKK